MVALALLLTACTAGVPADSEAPSDTATQTPAPETALPSEMPEAESSIPVEPQESMNATEMPPPESSAPMETVAPNSATPTETSAPANTATTDTPSPAPAETYAPASSAPETVPPPESTAPVETPEPTEPIEEQESNTMTITINGQVFSSTLYDNETAAALKEKMPLTLDMSELNGNEKYNYLSFSLPTNASNPGQIHAGDLMLYGSDCLVLFYESFPTNYRYTPIGRINDPSGLADAVGRGGVQVTFTLG